MFPSQNSFFYPYNYYNRPFNRYLYKGFSLPTEQRLSKQNAHNTINYNNEINNKNTYIQNRNNTKSNYSQNENNQANSSYTQTKNNQAKIKNDRYNQNVNKQSNNCSSENVKSSQNRSNTNDDYFFELFGLKLYFDDVLLIVLIFFLYQEGVRDDELFISLILLLLS